MRVKILQPAVRKEQLPVQQVSPACRKIYMQAFIRDAGAMATLTTFLHLRYIATFFNFFLDKQYRIRIADKFDSLCKKALNSGRVFQGYVLVNKLLWRHVQENAILYLAPNSMQGRHGTRDHFTCYHDTERTCFTPFLKYNN